jgi:RimJ/RimL family protein N-acetyltransferase
MSGYPVIEIERLILRIPQAADLDGWAFMNADEETNRFIGGVRSRAETWRQLCTMRGRVG